jgi:hypothetical protein
MGRINYPEILEVPSQTGNSGKYLTTDGSNSSWGAVLADDDQPILASQIFG